jgi:hypothetical protein
MKFILYFPDLNTNLHKFYNLTTVQIYSKNWKRISGQRAESWWPACTRTTRSPPHITGAAHRLAQLGYGLPGLMAQRHGAAWHCAAHTVLLHGRVRQQLSGADERHKGRGHGGGLTSARKSGVAEIAGCRRRRVDSTARW